jgi:hypothetical protein
MSEQYPYKYDVIVKMTISIKEDLPEKAIANSVEAALWGVELTTFADASIGDLNLEVEKNQEDKDVSI